MFSHAKCVFKTALIVSSALGTVAHAQEAASAPRDDADEQIVVTGEVSTFGATKSDAPIVETPRSISVVTAREFQDRGALTLSNTLNYTAGVTSNAFGLSTRGDFATIRGLDAPEYQDNLQVQFGFYNNARVDIYTLEQVEVLKGPASVLYGQAAPGGIVSTVSKIAGRDKLGKEMVFTAGNFDRYQASLDYGFDLSGNGNLTGRLVAIVRNSGTEVDFVNDDAIVIAPSVTYDNGRTAVTALFNYTERKGDTDSQFLPLYVTACQSSQVTFSDPGFCAGAPAQGVDNSTYLGDPGFNRYDTQSVTATVFLTHDFSDALRFEGTGRYRDNEAVYLQAWPAFLGDGNPRVLPDGTLIGRSVFGGPAGSTQYAFDARLRANFETGPIRHEVLAGVNYQDVDTFENQAFFNLPTTFNVFRPVYDLAGFPTSAQFDAARFLTENQTESTDLYLIDRMSIGNLILDLGVRYSSVNSRDAANDQKDEEYPITAGALYKTSIGLNPYVSYAESFRATVGTDVLTSTPLLPRRGEQIEAGFKYQPPGGSSYFSVAYYKLEENNLVEFVAAGQTQPGLTIEAEGVEVEALVRLGDVSFDFDFRHQNAREVNAAGVSLPRASLPDTTASLWTMWVPSAGPLDGLRVGAGVRYASQNESNGTAFPAANGFAATPNRIVTAGYTVFDALLAYRFASGIEASLNVRNLADKQYYATCLSRGDCFPGEQRTILGSLAFRF
ncbi:TonB-dependent siderophore receptor [Blastomonas sp. AAP53]|uniref:TonB-dependent siderophore receptor n=1 Tax=Blastomonas sp. AAP53 TaxID=1248760 RepID=UPI000368F5A5|nr:TonB-dependent siderophore receptor [Blastomonas sp. AAP53]